MKNLIIFPLIVILIFTMTACNSTINEQREQQPKEEHKEQERVYEIISENIIIGKGTERELAGKLSLPKDYDGKVPAVVLVHGSGPQDMDETIYDNKPFRDIAEYLSANGIAVIRYDKRTFVHFSKMAQEFGGSLTVYEETIQDAILAAELLKTDLRIDKNRVYILGHSLGGMLAPRIHASGGNFAGLILFAGSPRSLLEIMGDQQVNYYLETKKGDELTEFLAYLDDGVIATQLASQIEYIINMPDDEAKATDGGSGVSLYYYKDLLLNPIADFIKDINVPLLVMQGDNDWQVFKDKDFAMYKELLGSRKNVTLKLYEGLNHYFMPSTVTKSINIQDEYKIKANIDEQVLKDIVGWIKAN